MSVAPLPEPPPNPPAETPSEDHQPTTFEGYTAVFDAKSLGSSSNDFALEQFKSNPMVAIQYDGDLSRIEENTRLNSLISHEKMTINEKHKSLYQAAFNSFLFMGTNKPVKITDSKSGIIRRLIDVTPLGVQIPKKRYKELTEAIKFELGHIAQECLEYYLENKDYYDNYHPVLMMSESNDFYNFMEENYIIFRTDDSTTLRAAWEMYKQYVEDANVKYPLGMREFKSELSTYWREYEDRVRKDDVWIRSYFSGFKTEIFEKFGSTVQQPPTLPINESHIYEDQSQSHGWIDFKEQASKLDEYCKDCVAQYATVNETPFQPWDKVTTTLSELDSKELHYLRVPDNLIVIDFDIKNEDGTKSFEKNLEEAAKWPKTYAELSKSGGGIHLHYIYNGDIDQLARLYADDIEIKVFTGKSSLRRKLTMCTSDDIATISSGLPVKIGGKKMINFKEVKTEEELKRRIIKNLNKEYMGATKPSVDLIYKMLEDAYESGLHYDLSKMFDTVYAFAASSSHQSDYCRRLVGKMHFKSDDISVGTKNNEQPLVFYDVEVFPNLFLINWKFEGTDQPVHRMINPTSKDVEMLMKYRLVGFNCRRYDNHILYGRFIGYTNEQLYQLSKSIINQNKKAFFGNAYNISYTDIYDYASKKQSLKKWEIELGIHHQELGMDWDQPVPEELWEKVAEYCDNDVISTEAVWGATQDDFLAREILAEIAGMNVNDTTNSLTTRIIFGNEKNPEKVYVELEKTFPGYEFVKTWNEQTKKYDMYNMYRGIDLGFGGYVYAEPGMYGNVALLDVESLHPHSMIAMNIFGKWTKNFEDLVKTRMYIKHKDYDKAKELFGGKLAGYLTDKDTAKKLSKALKIAINSVYGLTSAKFDNPFRDPRNENNIVALRGALFMKTLQDEVTARGFKVAHIKTDSIKIPDATPEIIEFCKEFAHKYGYNFAHEATYDRICLVNDAVYIARYKTLEDCARLYEQDYVDSSADVLSDNKEHPGEWTATGTQFQIPYVFKTCFSHEPIAFGDLCETKEVKNTAIYLDMNEGQDTTEEDIIEELLSIRATPFEEHGPLTKREQKIVDAYSGYSNDELYDILSNMHSLKFVGRIGLFVPILPGHGGGRLLRENKTTDGHIKYDAVVGTKGYRWLEAEEVVNNNLQDSVDRSYHESLVDGAIETINQYGDYEWFTSDEPYVGPREFNCEMNGVKFHGDPFENVI